MGHFSEVRRLRGAILEGEEIEGSRFGQVRRFMGVILEGEEIERGYTSWPKAHSSQSEHASRRD